MFNRRSFLKRTAITSVGAGIFGISEVQAEKNRPSSTKVQQAHEVLWGRFIGADGIVLDYTDSKGKLVRPTPEELQQGKPNALGWWTPVENGPMFTGLYMDALLQRWKVSKDASIAAKARRLLAGLMKLSQQGAHPSFVARGLAADGKSHYAMSSDDQVIGCLLGLWWFHRSSLATLSEKSAIQQRFLRIAESLLAHQWLVPAEPPFGTRGSFGEFNFDSAARLLFICKAAHVLSEKSQWRERYYNLLRQMGGPKEERRDRFTLLQQGMVHWYAPYHSWTSASSVAALRELYELEESPLLYRAYLQGLKVSANLAARSFELAKEYEVGKLAPFETDWRYLNASWKPQRSVEEATVLAKAQLKSFIEKSPQREREMKGVKEPAAAAMIVALCPDPANVTPHREKILALLERYNYSELFYASFFYLENAYWRLQTEAALTKK